MQKGFKETQSIHKVKEIDHKIEQKHKVTQNLLKDTQGSNKVIEKRRFCLILYRQKSPQKTCKSNHIRQKPTNAKLLHRTQNNFKVRQNLFIDKQIYHKVTENDKLQL